MPRMAWLAILTGVGAPLLAVLAGSAVAPWAAGALGLLLLVGIAAGSAWPGLQAWGPVRRRGHGPGVALTFDDGPDPVGTPCLLDALEAAGARATFFLLLDRAERHPELVRRIALHHEIGLHGHAHSPAMVFLPPSRAARRLREAALRLAALAGRPVRHYRPPFGATSPGLLRAVREADLELTWCSVRTHDGGGASAESVRRSCARALPGDIVLMHDDRPATAEALPVILRDLADRGLPAVTLSECCS